MSKELEKEFEALDQLMDLVTCQGCFEKAQKCYYVIEEAFDELKAIKEAKPSEAMECLEELDCLFYLDKKRTTEGGTREEYEFYPSDTKEYHTIKQYILKSQETEKENARNEEILQKYYQQGITLDSVRVLKQERDNYKKVLDIIFEKNVDICLLKQVSSFTGYNEIMLKIHDKENYKPLSQEEFNLLKEE